jgi:(p)ppGpp synthase/HD superfamily hydrolase
LRKGTQIPYVAHLLAVAALVLEHGGDEDQAIAALLHDAAEDHGGEVRLADIHGRFGDRVEAIVRGCSDALPVLGQPKGAWPERKEAYHGHLEHVDESVLLVSAADKLHNARAVLLDYREVGEAVWKRFKGGREGTLWNYRALVEVLERRLPGSLSREFAETVGHLEERVAAGEPAGAKLL